MEKRYYIEDIERELGICRKTYYNWEKLKKVPPAKRDPMNGYRYWTDDDVNWLKKMTGRNDDTLTKKGGKAFKGSK